MKRIIISFIAVSLLLSTFPLQVFSVSSVSYPSVKASWLKKKTEAKISIPPFFKTHTGVLVQELRQNKSLRNSTVIPISADSISFTLPLGFDYVDSGKYVINMAFCSKDTIEITKDNCGNVLKKRVSYVKKKESSPTSKLQGTWYALEDSTFKITFNGKTYCDSRLKDVLDETKVFCEPITVKTDGTLTGSRLEAWGGYMKLNGSQLEFYEGGKVLTKYIFEKVK